VARKVAGLVALFVVDRRCPFRPKVVADTFEQLADERMVPRPSGRCLRADRDGGVLEDELDIFGSRVKTNSESGGVSTDMLDDVGEPRAKNTFDRLQRLGVTCGCSQKEPESHGPAVQTPANRASIAFRTVHTGSVQREGGWFGGTGGLDQL